MDLFSVHLGRPGGLCWELSLSLSLSLGGEGR